MTAVPKRIVSHAAYQGIIALDRTFSMMNPKCDWKKGDKITIDYDENKDMVIVRRVHV